MNVLLNAMASAFVFGSIVWSFFGKRDTDRMAEAIGTVIYRIGISMFITWAYFYLPHL